MGTLLIKKGRALLTALLLTALLLSLAPSARATAGDGARFVGIAAGRSHAVFLRAGQTLQREARRNGRGEACGFDGFNLRLLRLTSELHTAMLHVIIK